MLHSTLWLEQLFDRQLFVANFLSPHTLSLILEIRPPACPSIQSQRSAFEPACDITLTHSFRLEKSGSITMTSPDN
jgi:hypothetical protein